MYMHKFTYTYIYIYIYIYIMFVATTARSTPLHDHAAAPSNGSAPASSTWEQLKR